MIELALLFAPDAKVGMYHLMQKNQKSRAFNPRPTLAVIINVYGCSFALMQKNQKIKACVE
jgi:hypothetical protein